MNYGGMYNVAFIVDCQTNPVRHNENVTPRTMASIAVLSSDKNTPYLVHRN